MNLICTDGKIVNDANPVLYHNNRAFRYGDGLFETMKMMNGKILLSHLHFERLFKSLDILRYAIPPSFTPRLLENLITELAERNQCKDLCRARLTVYRGNGNLHPALPCLNYIIECSALNSPVNMFDEKGISIGLYTPAKKACDIFSAVKSANFLPYVMGTVYAQENKLDDCLLLNTKGNIADATIANVFLVKGNEVFTPALTEGCVNGVMRRHLLEKLPGKKYACYETEIKEADLQGADEIFLTNAITGIRSVRQYENKQYGFSFAAKIYRELIIPLFT